MTVLKPRLIFFESIIFRVNKVVCKCSTGPIYYVSVKFQKLKFVSSKFRRYCIMRYPTQGIYCLRSRIDMSVHSHVLCFVLPSFSLIRWSMVRDMVLALSVWNTNTSSSATILLELTVLFNLVGLPSNCSCSVRSLSLSEGEEEGGGVA